MGSHGRFIGLLSANRAAEHGEFHAPDHWRAAERHVHISVAPLASAQDTGDSGNVLALATQGAASTADDGSEIIVTGRGITRRVQQISAADMSVLAPAPPR